MQLDLGAGNKVTNKKTIRIDIKPECEPDLLHDLNKGIPYPNNSIDIIYARHFLEHVKDIFFMMAEIHRVLKIGGIAKIEVPYYSSFGALTILDHKHCFGYNSFDPYQKGYNPPDRYKETFRIKKRYLIWQFVTEGHKTINFIAKFPSFIIRKITTNNVALVWIYQKFFAYILPIDAVYFELEKK